MIKEGQSLLDFINFLPLQAVVRQQRQAPLSNKEAQILYNIWESDKDQYGNIILSDDIDSMIIASLTTKGFIKSKSNTTVMSRNYNRSVEITKEGKEIIRNIILYSEKNAFEKQSNKNINYESIYTNMTTNKLNKVASWLSRTQKNGNNS